MKQVVKRWRWLRETVGTFLRFLETRTMVGIETSKHTDSGYTRITIQNYERYQGGEEEPEPIPSAIPSSMQSRNPSSIHPASDCGAGAQGSVIAAAIAQARERTGNPDGCESACPTAPASTATSTQHPPAIPSATIKEVKKGKTSMADADGASAGTAGGSKGQPRKPRTTHPDTEALLVEFQERYKARCRDDYFPSHGRDRKLLSELLRRKGPEEARTRMHLFFENGTKRTRDLGDYSVPAFHAAWPQIGVLLARGDL